LPDSKIMAGGVPVPRPHLVSRDIARTWSSAISLGSVFITLTFQTYPITFLSPHSTSRRRFRAAYTKLSRIAVSLPRNQNVLVFMFTIVPCLPVPCSVRKSTETVIISLSVVVSLDVTLLHTARLFVAIIIGPYNFRHILGSSCGPFEV